MNSKKEIYKNITFILSHTSHPGNIGSAARAMKTMGFHNLELICPEKFPDPEADALASGAGDVLEKTKVNVNIEEALSRSNIIIGFTARKRELSQEHLPSHEVAKKIIKLGVSNKIALLFGNETSGLSNDEIQHCHYLGYIDANQNYSSLNLSQAVQVMAYALRQEINLNEFNTSTKKRVIASFAEHNGFYGHLEGTLKNLDLYDEVQGKRLMHRIRLMFNRIQMDKDEVNIFRGILNQINKKID
jgi:TrmH family RNA methyltransferase